ncbi:hypothetical protein [Tissierella praeacuta]|uniref:hypothetical protein n=1 Tax=Tissierella praeacuta TaxID=43131 RepID=UPI0028A7DE20|nr:hypothetical protein [Tissierella praeacuta]
MTKEKKQVNEIKKKEKLIYCGPNIGFKVIKDTVYIGGIPKILDEEIKECKEIKNLFIPLESYVEIKRKILEEGTIENLSYKAVQSFLKDKRGEK